MLGDSVSMSDALVVTGFSMTVVFIALLIISFIIERFKDIFYKDNKKQETKVVKKQTKKATKPKVKKQDNDEELVAVIAAAVAASMSKSVSEINIKSIRRASENIPAWSRVGRQEQIYNNTL